jgi:hypothetical protein
MAGHFEFAPQSCTAGTLGECVASHVAHSVLSASAAVLEPHLTHTVLSASAAIPQTSLVLHAINKAA